MVQLLGIEFWEGRGVVADDLPAGGSVFKDEEEVAVGVAAAGGGAFEVEAAGGGGEVVVERLDFELGEGEGAHFLLGGVGGFVVGEHLGVAAGDAGADEEDVGGVFVAGGEGVEVAAVPVGGGVVEDGEDGFGGVGGLGGRCKREGEDKGEDEGARLEVHGSP